MNRTAYLTWLKVACIFLMGTAVLATLASFAAGSELWRWLLDIVMWPLDGQPEGFSQAGHTLNAILGGVTLGWGLLLYLLTTGPLAAGQHQIAQMMLVSTLTWFVVDSFGSIMAGTHGNVILNAVFLIVFLPPLLVLRKPEAVRQSQL